MRKGKIFFGRYVGLSSTGITFKPGSASLGTTSSRGGDRYGGFGGASDGEALSGSYKDRDQGEDKFVKSTNKPRRGDNGDPLENTPPKGSTRHSRFVLKTSLIVIYLLMSQ